jgi:DNA polymerase
LTVPAPPPTLARDLRAGTRLVAGLGHSTVIPSIDFETYSEAGFEWDADRQRWVQPAGASGTAKGLPLVGAAVYAQHPSTEVLCMAYNLKDGSGPKLWTPGMPPPADLLAYLANGGLIEAWNSPFEGWIWNEVCTRRYGFPELPLRQLRCAMAKARAWGLPGSLAAAAEVLGVPIQKDKDGKRLLDKFSVPRNPTKADARRRVRPEDDPADFERLCRYCLTDIDTEDEVAARVPDLEGEELEFWLADQAINRRGAHIDRKGVEDCCAIVDAALERYNAELRELTGGVVERASEVQKLSGWLGGMGISVASLDEDAVADALLRLEALVSEMGGRSEFSVHRERIGMLDKAKRALQIRQAVGSASVKKVYSMRLKCARGGRIHDLFSYHAARTGRPTGNNPQPTNMPKAGPDVVRCGHTGRTKHAAGCGRYHGLHLSKCPWCGVMGPPGRKAEWCVEAAEDALEVISWRSLTLLEHYFGDAMLAVSGSLRGLFDATPGRHLVSSDFTAIEAVVTAALAGEQWRMDVFRAGTDIYLESISRSTGTPVADMLAHRATTGMHHPLRQTGKTQELALAYMGWVGALKAFGAVGTDEELKQQVLAWRKASPAIVELAGGQTRDFGRSTEYFGMEGACVQALLNPGVRQHVKRLDGTDSGLSYLHHGHTLYLTLLGGRHIAYQNPRLTATGTWRGYKITFEGWNTNPKKGVPGWITMDIYAGICIENAGQAVARDIQRRAILNCERADLPVVLHVYDEDVADCGLDRTVEELEACMMDVPDWAREWPIKAAGGWSGRRYRKA